LPCAFSRSLWRSSPAWPKRSEHLSARHELTLFTKGHVDEQKLKIERSGTGARSFARITAIVKEKDVAGYRQLASGRGMDPALTWMIGNSPKSTSTRRWRRA